MGNAQPCRERDRGEGDLARISLANAIAPAARGVVNAGYAALSIDIAASAAVLLHFRSTHPYFLRTFSNWKKRNSSAEKGTTVTLGFEKVPPT